MSEEPATQVGSLLFGEASRSNLEPAGARNPHVFTSVGEREAARVTFTVRELEPYPRTYLCAVRKNNSQPSS